MLITQSVLPVNGKLYGKLKTKTRLRQNKMDPLGRVSPDTSKSSCSKVVCSVLTSTKKNASLRSPANNAAFLQAPTLVRACLRLAQRAATVVAQRAKRMALMAQLELRHCTVFV